MTMPTPHTPKLLEGEDLAAMAYREIRQAIISLSLQPGQRLSEAALAEWLGTSRTPIREVLRRLSGEGLISIPTSGGALVTELSVEDVENAYYVIEAIEGVASRLAAERLSEADATELHACLDQMSLTAKSNDMPAWVAADANFHNLIRTNSQNSRLELVAHVIYPTIDRVRNMYLLEGSDPDRLSVATEAHLTLGQAILNRDGDRAEQLCRSLFQQARLDNVRLLKQWIVPLRRTF